MTSNPLPRAGFTLVETLAAMTIAAAVLVSASRLIHDTAFSFDRGTRSVDQTEKFALAIDALTRDFGAARFAVHNDEHRAKASFAATPPGDILFVTGGGRGSSGRDEVVRISIERGETSAKIIRRRAPWRGPRQRLEDAELRDAVTLLEGPFDISFEFSERTPTGRLIWTDHWSGETGLPQSVRLTLRDVATGASLLNGGEFPIHANAPIDCAQGRVDCLAIARSPTVSGNTPIAPQPDPAK